MCKNCHLGAVTPSQELICQICSKPSFRFLFRVTIVELMMADIGNDIDVLLLIEISGLFDLPHSVPLFQSIKDHVFNSTSTREKDNIKLYLYFVVTNSILKLKKHWQN